MTSKNSPSEFEITCIKEGIRYQYGFSLLRDRVIEEWLLVYKSGKAQEWFRRAVNEKTGEDEYKFSSYLKGQKLTWQRSTRKEALFLAVAAVLNSEQLLPLYQWLLEFDVLDNYLSFSRTINTHFPDNKQGKQYLLDFLIAADLGIMDIDVKTEIIKTPKRSAVGKDGKSAEYEKRENKRPVFVHQHDGISVQFEFEEESEGTQRMFLLAFYILKALERGMVLIIDELESSLHPKLVRFIIELFNVSRKQKRSSTNIYYSQHGHVGYQRDVQARPDMVCGKRQFSGNGSLFFDGF